MKRFVGAALAAIALISVAGEASARCRDTNGSAPGGVRCWDGGRRGGGTTVIQGGSSGVDVNQLLLLQALGGAGLAGSTGGLGALALPLLLNQQQTETVVVEGRRSRRR